jgi:hypothetical protein
MVEARINKAVTSPRTPRRGVVVEARIDKAVTSPRTPRRGVVVEARINKAVTSPRTPRRGYSRVGRGPAARGFDEAADYLGNLR